MSATQTPAAELAAACTGCFGRNDDATLTATTDALFAVAGYVSRNYGDHGYRIGQVANAAGGGVFSIRTSDGCSLFVAVDRYGNVAPILDADELEAVA